MGFEAPPASDLAVGQIFLNRQNGEDHAPSRREIVRSVLKDLKLEVLTFRSVPVIESALGERAEQSRPWMAQVIIRRTDDACEAGDAFERLLYVARKRIVITHVARGVQRLYVASLSSRTIVYKGLVLAEELAHFYPDLSDPDYKTAIAVFHQRYSTNTFPTWSAPSPSVSSVTTVKSTPCKATKLDAGARSGSGQPLLGGPGPISAHYRQGR